MAVLWDDSPAVRDWPGLAPLDGDATCGLCVVGLGASGLAAVEWGLGRGLDVIGLDAGRVAAGAAGRNGGFLLGGLARFHHDVTRRLGGDLALGLYRATVAELDRLDAALPGLVRRTGSLRLAGLPGEPVDEVEAADCADMLTALTEAGIAAERYEGSLGVGVLIHDDGAANPAERCVRTAAALRARARLHERTPVTKVSSRAVDTPRGRVDAGAVVVCVDGRLEALLPDLAGRVRTARLQMVGTAPLPPVLDRPVYARWGYDYAQQATDGRLAVGGGRDLFEDEEWTDDPTPTAPVQDHLDRLAARFAGGPVEVTHRWVGLAGFTDDGMPVCELVDDGVAAAGGYCGTGNLVGPLVARAAARLAVEGMPAVPAPADEWPLAGRRTVGP